jgi:membrane-bound ClpP family serine protease
MHRLTSLLVDLLVIAAATVFALVLRDNLEVSADRIVQMGPYLLLSLNGEVVSWSGHAGRVRAHGEIWQARAAAVLAPGSRVRVAARDGLVLEVKPEKKEM